MAKKRKKPKHTPGGRQKRKKSSIHPGNYSQQRKLQEALFHHQAGRFAQAEDLYRQILLAEPNHPEALHFLGLLAHQVGKSEVGIDLIKKAVNFRPDYFEAYINLGNAFRDQGKLDDAIRSYGKALALKPDYADLHYNLGNVLRDQGKPDEAIASFRRAITLQPDDVEALINLGNVLKEQGHLGEAINSYQRALTMKPNFAEGYNNLGNALKDQGKLDEAIANFRRAINLKPYYVEAYYNLGNTLQDHGLLGEAIKNYQQALNLKHDYVEALINLGTIYRGQGKTDKAITSFNKALSLQPDNALVHYNIGTVLMDQGKLEGAISSFHQALNLRQDYAEAYNNLGNALKSQGKLEEAISNYRKALAQKPYYMEVHSNLLFCLNYLSDMTQEEIYTESLKWNDRFVKSVQIDTPEYANILSSERRLRIGYVSPDFREHSVAFFIEPVIKAHSRKKVEIFCYANVRKPDEVTQRLQVEADHWYSIVGMTNEAAAARIKQDRIDILVDLAGHTRNNSLPVFGRRPAPVQVTWLGYPNTTGLETIDYRFTDAVADPPGEEENIYSEKLIRLKYGFLCYQPMTSAPRVAQLPCLEQGYITFGSFNNLTKVTHEVIKVWAAILRAVPDSRLLLKAKQLSDDQTMLRFLEMFAKEGIAEDRLEMHSRMSRQEDHLRLYNRVDIGLDPFPYNGTTTTCEALWMGVPVVTLLGQRHAGRVGASIMHQVELEDLVAHSMEKYIELARLFARDKDRLENMRAGLRDRMQESPLMTPVLFTSHLEDAYYQMWREYCAKF